MKTTTSKDLFKIAKMIMPGGVNSPVRAFQAVKSSPLFISRAEGAYMYDEDGNEYIDLINSWGAMILGHTHQEVEEAIFKSVIASPSFGTSSRKEIELAELIIEMMPSIEKIRMVNSGTEATMSAIRLARGFTHKDKIIKFEGCYHGHGDSFLISAGSGAATTGVPDSLGITKGTARDTLLAPYNNIEQVKTLVDKYRNEIAAIIVEPVAGNMGCVLPKDGFLSALRTLCNDNDILLIFDEVMTGFRLAKGGAQQLYGITPDLTTLGKIIGGGMPVGAYGGRKELMSCISPEGDVYQAGTLSGNPVAMAAGFAQLSYLNEHEEIYKKTEKTTSKIVEGYTKIIKKKQLNYTINHIGSMFSLFFTDQKVIDFQTAKTCNINEFSNYFKEMLCRGIYLPPSQFESVFISTSISEKEISIILSAFEEYVNLALSEQK